MSGHKDRLHSLRSELKRRKLDGFIVPHADEYQGEYMPERARRLAWLTGFTGSAGAAVILKDRAVVMSDGRYTIQLKQQVDPALYDVADSTKTTVAAWLGEHAKDMTIGFDPWLHTPREVKKLEEAGIRLRPVDENLIDAIWPDQPPAPQSEVEIFPEKFAGRSVADKLDLVSAAIAKAGALACVLTLPDSIAWLLNIRASDVPHIPLALSYAIVRADGAVEWFIAPARISPQVRAHLGNRVQTSDPEGLADAVDALAKQARKAGNPVWLDGRRAPHWFTQRLGKAGVLDRRDPCIAPKARKTPAEQAAMREAHARDGAAMVRFLTWLEQEAPKGTQTEITVAEKLESIRRAHPAYRDSSFDTIAGFGSNGAIVHYRASEQTSRAITAPGLLLIDSGAQYEDGTTDITRTVAIGEPSAEMRAHYTLVLKAHIAVARAKFPKGTTGAQIDALARAPLWQAGLDYAHGTGHGVGCYLSVHEEAASLSPKGQDAIEPGMILSNEPGYYREGAYGIRTENLVLAREDEHGDGDRIFFETLTLAPYDAALIDLSRLSAEEMQWLKGYYEVMEKTMAPRLEAQEKEWLSAQVQKLFT